MLETRLVTNALRTERERRQNGFLLGRQWRMIAFVHRRDPISNDERLAERAILGAAHSLSGHYEAAVPFIDQSLAIDPNSAFAWQRKGWLRTSLSDPDDGIACFERAMRVSPRAPYNFDALLGMGCAHLLAERFEDAVALLLRGIAMRPSATWAWRSVVAAYASLDRMDDARAAMAKFTAAHPGITVSRVAASMVGLNPTHRRLNLDGLRRAGLPD